MSSKPEQSLSDYILYAGIKRRLGKPKSKCGGGCFIDQPAIATVQRTHYRITDSRNTTPLFIHLCRECVALAMDNEHWTIEEAC